MYIFVMVQEKEHYYKDGPLSQVRVNVRLEEASGERCLIVPYQEFNMSVVNELKPRAIAMSGFGGHFQSRRIEWFWGMDEVLHRADIPIICFCGSHQLLGFSYNLDLHTVARLEDEPMRQLDPTEDLPRLEGGDPEYDLSSYYVANGFFPIRRVKDDPLFAGLPETMMMRCWHYCEVKRLPPGFELLASSGHCRIEAMRHKEKPLYGTQFHPEEYAPPFDDGRTLLRNFARIVEEYWSRK